MIINDEHFTAPKPEDNSRETANRNLPLGLPLGCDHCVLPAGYAGAEFVQGDSSETICNFCRDHQQQEFLGEEKLIQDLDLAPGEQVGITVSGGKDSMRTWLWLVDHLGADRVVAFNHQKLGLVHPLAEDNLHRAQAILGTPLIQVADTDMLPRFRKNLEVFLKKPDAAMVRVALCAGCRVGISGKMFDAGRNLGIKKFVSAASYLELAPFKAATMREKGDGDERKGLLNGLAENPAYDHDDNIQVIMLEDDHCHKSKLSGGGSFNLYPDIRFYDFDQYFPNIPEESERIVRDRLGWTRPKRSWHFDCQVESFKDLFYYGLLGYTETDFNLSAQVRYDLMTRKQAIDKLVEARREIVEGKEVIFGLMQQLGVEHLIGEVNHFYNSSKFLSEVPQTWK